MTRETMAVQLCDPNVMARCQVCEPLGATLYEQVKGAVGHSERQWVFVPCTRELLQICLNCGNTLRQKRAE